MNELEQYLNDYLDYLTVKNYSKITIKDYHHSIMYFYRWLKEKKIESINQIMKETLLKYQTYLIHKNLAIHTQLSKLSAIREFLNYLVKVDVLISSPANQIKLPQKPNVIKWTLLTVKDIKKLLLLPDVSTYVGFRDRAMLEIAYTTGIRVSELCGLKLNEINYIDKTIRISNGKGNKDRIVPACTRSLDFTKKYISNHRETVRNQGTEEYIWLSRRGNKMIPRVFQYRVTYYGKCIQLKTPVTPHCLRIASATHMLQNGADIRYVQEMLGHTDIDTTMKYLQLEKTELKRIHTVSHPREIEALDWK